MQDDVVLAPGAGKLVWLYDLGVRFMVSGGANGGSVCPRGAPHPAESARRTPPHPCRRGSSGPLCQWTARCRIGRRTAATVSAGYGSIKHRALTSSPRPGWQLTSQITHDSGPPNTAGQSQSSRGRQRCCSRWRCDSQSSAEPRPSRPFGPSPGGGAIFSPAVAEHVQRAIGASGGRWR